MQASQNEMNVSSDESDNKSIDDMDSSFVLSESDSGSCDDFDSNDNKDDAKSTAFILFWSWGHSKSTFTQNFQFLTPLPLVHSCSFYMYPPNAPSPQTYVWCNKLNPPLKNFRDVYDVYFE